MWNDRFATADYVFGKDPAVFLTEHADWLTPGARGLSVADGEGRNAVFMAERGVETVAMDASENAITKARALARERGVTVDHRLSDIFDWTWTPEAYDIVVAVFIQFLAPPERDAIFAGMVQTLKPGGVLLLHGYTPEQIAHGTGGPRVAENLYTEALLRESFAGLEIVELKSYERDIREGAGHSGLSALIDLVARKPL